MAHAALKTSSGLCNQKSVCTNDLQGMRVNCSNSFVSVSNIRDFQIPAGTSNARLGNKALNMLGL